MSTLNQAELDRLLAEAKEADVSTSEALESFRITHFGRQGLLKDLNERFRAVPGPEKREMGQALNAFKQALQAHFDGAKAGLTAAEDAGSTNGMSTSAPVESGCGSLPPTAAIDTPPNEKSSSPFAFARTPSCAGGRLRLLLPWSLRRAAASAP